MLSEANGIREDGGHFRPGRVRIPVAELAVYRLIKEIESKRAGDSVADAYAGVQKKNMRSVISLIISGIILAGPVAAKHWHDDEKHWKRHADRDDEGDHKASHDSRGCYFRPGDTRVITEYYAPHYRPLPPGLQKKLRRTGHLPPGWEKRMEPMPAAVERRLTPVPAWYSRGFIDGYAVVYSPRTQIVVDIVAVFGK